MNTLPLLSSLLASDARSVEAPQPKCCSWCNRFYRSNGEYCERPFIVINLSHGICPACYRVQMNELKTAKVEIERAAR